MCAQITQPATIQKVTERNLGWVDAGAIDLSCADSELPGRCRWAVRIVGRGVVRRGADQMIRATAEVLTLALTREGCDTKTVGEGLHAPASAAVLRCVITRVRTTPTLNIRTRVMDTCHAKDRSRCKCP